MTFIGVALILLLVAVVSSLIRAFRAIRLNPVAARRE
jgi:hypothetical protein